MDDTTLRITEDIGQVKLGDTILPGIYQALEVTREVRFAEQSVPGASGASRQPLGYEDARITLDLVLAPMGNGTSPRQQLQVLAALHQAQDGKGRPRVHTIAHPLLAAWGIRQVVFTSLRAHDDSYNDLIACTLELKEHVPRTTKKEARRRSPAAAVPGGTAVPDGAILFAPDDVFLSRPYSVQTADSWDFLTYGTGTPKPAQTPAVDDDPGGT